MTVRVSSSPPVVEVPPASGPPGLKFEAATRTVKMPSRITSPVYRSSVRPGTLKW